MTSIEVDARVREYQNVVRAMQEIINSHMQAAFFEINHEYGITPTEVALNVAPVKDYSNGCIHGLYISSSVEIGAI